MTEPAATDERNVPTPRYDFAGIDIDSGSTHADVVLLVGESRRVLELGPATGYMSRVFRERGCTVVGIELDPNMAKRAEAFCERVIVGDLEQLDFDETLGAERFDVIVAADVLEHLRDPLTVLRRLQPFLTADGYVVLSLPNIAHGSVRLALLSGSFDYRDIGLLDRTHLTFFTRESIEQMLDEAELGIAELHRHELNLDASEVSFDESLVPAELRAQLEHDLDSRTYQFVVRAFPMGREGLREMQRRMRDAVLRRDDAEREIRELRHTRERLAELETTVAAISGREGELRRALVEAHDQLLRRDAELEQVDNAIDKARQDEAARARDEIARRDDEIRRLRIRLNRILTSPPAKLYDSVRTFPGVRRIVATRQAGFDAAVAKRTSPED